MTARTIGSAPPYGRKITRLIATVSMAALVGSVGIAAAADSASASSSSVSSVSAGAQRGVKVAAAAKSVGIPRTAMAEASIDKWKLAPAQNVAEVGPVVGSAKSGSIALGIDAPVITKTRTAATTKATVAPGTTYAFSAYVRVASRTLKWVPASFKINKKTIPLTKIDARWKRVTGTYKTGSSETSVNIAVNLQKAVRGFAVDHITLAPTAGSAKGVNVVPNGSFEGVGVKRGIVSTSLIATTKTAAVAVALPKGKITWEAHRGNKRVAKGSATSKAEITALPLTGVPQGYYTLTVRSSDKKTMKTKIAVLDSPNPWITQDSRYGVGLHVEKPIYAEAARHTRALGLSGARNDIYWYLVEKKKGSFDFSDYAAPLDKLNAQGVGVLGILGYGSGFYGNAYAPKSKTALKAYGKYAGAVAKRFNLAGVEVYNEFNHKPKNKSGCVTAKCYAPILKQANASVGKVKPKLPVIAGATARYDAKWFDDLWKKQGGLKQADAVSFHPYEVTGKPEALTGILSKARQSMKKNGKTTKPIWITELGTSSRTGNRTTTEQASVLVRSSVTAFAGGVKKFYWYDLINDGPSAKDHESNFGLYSHPQKGIAALAPKQGAFSQALTITQLGGRGFRATEKAGTGVVSQAFGSKSDTVRVVWSAKGKKTASIKTKTPVVVVNFDGTSRKVKPKNGVVKVSVTTNPVFVRSGKATAGVTR